METLLSYGFLQRALVSGVFISVACAMLGLFLILRKDSMMGHGLAHITFGGIAVGLFLKFMPLAVALAVAVAASLGIMKLKERAGLYGDTAIAIFSSVGMALGILLATLAQSFGVDLLSYLFGDILAIEPAEVWLSTALAGTVLAAIGLNYHKLMYMTFAPESARVSGIKTKRLDLMVTVLTAVTIVLGMKVVGILMVTALIVIPAAAGLQAAANFKSAMAVSAGVAVFSVVLGLILAFTLDIPASAAIVLLAFFLFLVCFFFKKRRIF